MPKAINGYMAKEGPLTAPPGWLEIRDGDQVTFRPWEAEGILPKAMRLASGRRVWRESELDAARERIAERRTARTTERLAS